MFSKPEQISKIFFIITLIGLLIYAVMAFYTFHIATIDQTQKPVYDNGLPIFEYKDGLEDNLKYILWWTDELSNTPIQEGKTQVLKNNCTYSNCYITVNKDILGKDNNYTNFDAIVFNINEVKRWRKLNFPRFRSPKQKYVFYSMESSETSPICNIHTDNYFNWTWSYKLYSDIFNPFIEIRDLDGKPVAPNPEVEWITDKTYLSKTQVIEYMSKTKAVAWIMNKCDGNIENIKFAKELRSALKVHSLALDIYGCNRMKCPETNNGDGCLVAIENDYFFYLALEDSIAEDYVTHEVLKAYHHNAVPIVLGGADYTKFLPGGSYINAYHTSVEKLAALINYIIRNPTVYLSFFRWRKYYTIHAVKEDAGICDFCKDLNDVEKFGHQRSYETFRKWWYYGSMEKKCYPKGAENYNEILSYLNNRS